MPDWAAANYSLRNSDAHNPLLESRILGGETEMKSHQPELCLRKRSTSEDVGSGSLHVFHMFATMSQPWPSLFDFEQEDGGAAWVFGVGMDGICT